MKLPSTKKLPNKKRGSWASLMPLGGVVFLMVGLRDIDNYINWGRFLISLALVGLVFGALLYYATARLFPKIKRVKDDDGFSLPFAFMISFALVAIGVGAIFNELNSDIQDCKGYEIQDLA